MNAQTLSTGVSAELDTGPAQGGTSRLDVVMIPEPVSGTTGLVAVMALAIAARLHRRSIAG